MDRKEELIEAARYVMNQKGFERTRVSDIVKQAGVAQGTFYLYFPSKGAVLTALAQKVSDECKKNMEAIEFSGDHITKNEFMDRLKNLSNGLISFFSENIDVMRLIENETSGDGFLAEIVVNIISRCEAVLENFLNVGYKSGILRNLDYKTVSKIILSGATKLFTSTIGEGSTPSEASINTMINFFIYGVLKG